MSAPRDEDALYDLVPDDESPAARTVAPRHDPDSLAARMGHVPPRHKAVSQPAADPRLEKLTAPSVLRDMVVPVALIIIGLVLGYLEVTCTARQPVSVAAALGHLFIRLVLSTGLMLLGIYLAVRFLEVCLWGTFPHAILRLCAIAIGPSAVYGLLVAAIGGVSGGLAGTLASVAIYFLLFRWLMRMDWSGAAICTLMTWILVAASNYAAFRVAGASGGAWV
jgi:hypothetical protein